MKLKENTNNIQMISASVKWTKDIETFLNQLFVKWQYIFGSHLEAAHYMKIGFSVVLGKNKLEKVLGKYNKLFLTNLKYNTMNIFILKFQSI